MVGEKSSEVLIIGAGPVGLFAALALARKGVRAAIVDRQWRTGAHSYALALHAETSDVLQSVGVQQSEGEAFPIDRVTLYDEQSRRAEIAVGPQPERRMAVMRQSALEHQFEQLLRSLGISVRWSHEVVRLAPKRDAVEVVINRLEKQSVGFAAPRTEWIVADTFSIEPRFVIAADGHRSFVRRSLGIDFELLAPPEAFAVFEFNTADEVAREMRLVLGQQAISALWPLGERCCRWSFQLSDVEVAQLDRTKSRIGVEIGPERYPALSETNLHRLLGERAPWWRNKITNVHWRMVVPFERRLAGSFGRGRVWLAGDAGHTTTPVGMQSMNVGLREARDLAEILAAILHEGASPERLEQYGQARLREWRRLLGKEPGLAPAADTERWIAENAGRLLGCLPASGEALAALAKQLRLNW